ncbi:unnamed protein product [Periconia digitata]|uniref:Uncharacterized protein n=1 Tax=Periconia digitata TaxID=1303443 RepID=A0A9W4XQD0_9PLEO|nr:unnamed protein product [Periconia digitata]
MFVTLLIYTRLDLTTPNILYLNVTRCPTLITSSAPTFELNSKKLLLFLPSPITPTHPTTETTQTSPNHASLHAPPLYCISRSRRSRRSVSLPLQFHAHHVTSKLNSTAKSRLYGCRTSIQAVHPISSRRRSPGVRSPGRPHRLQRC